MATQNPSRLRSSRGKWRGYNIFQIVRRLGLTAGLKLALDMGDLVSNPGSGQKLLDLAGSGYDFFRGNSNTATTDDPSFNGTAGRLSSAEYLGFDGGDVMRYDTTNETWMQNLHKNNAVFTFILGVYWPGEGTGDQGILGTSGIDGGGTIGVDWMINDAEGNTSDFVVRNSGVVTRFRADAVPCVTGWNIIGISVNEAAGADAMITMVNGKTTSQDATYTSPSASNASQTLELMSRGNGGKKAPNGARFGFCVAWEGTALSAAQMLAFYEAIRGRYSL